MTNLQDKREIRNSDKRRVLIFIDWFYPAFKAGGPIKSVFNIINALSDQIDFIVITSNKDVDGTVLEVETNKEIEQKNFKIYYLDETADVKGIYREVLDAHSPEVIYYNSMFSYSFTIKPLLFFKSNTNLKQIIAPRGMLREGALSIKPFKKRVFLFLGKYTLFKKITWHASTEEERQEVIRVFGEHAKIKVAQNISSTARKRTLSDSFKKLHELKLVFIARILPIKNLLFVLKLMDVLKELPDLTLDIYGPIEDHEYWEKCLEIIQSDKRISYQRLLSPQEIDTTLKKYQFYVLPSLNENYGHSIVEAINAGIPVFISNDTPWKNLEEERVGFSIDLNELNEWTNRLKLAYDMDHVTYQQWSESCFEYSKKTFVNNSVINKNVDLFLSN